jgi:uncharacterized protein (TIGR03435 family)
MTPLVLDIALRSLLIAAGTAAVLWALRIKTAATQHAAWTAVLIAMLLLPIWSAAGVTVSVPVLPAAAGSSGVSATASIAAQASADLEPTATPAASAAEPRTAAQSFSWHLALIAVYVSGLLVLLGRLALGTLQAHRLRRSAVIDAGRATSTRCAAPITVGLWRPMLILPASWPQWSAAQLDAVLTHEEEHARRRDPLVQWFALVNRAVFWFHPLAWWLERRLASLAEEACDAAVLAAGHSPQDYSTYLLDMARAIARRGARLDVVGMAMPGTGLKPRLRQILYGLPIPPVSRTRALSTIAFCAGLSVVFGGGTLAERAVTTQVAQAKFDVVSIKPCGPKGSGGSRSGGAGASVSPHRLVEDCLTLYNMIQNAYIRFADGRGHDPWAFADTPIEGGPDWIKHDTFLVEATAEGATQEMLRGPMLQTALEDRFRLKTHRETRQGPVYELVVASGGSKLKPAAAGVCVPPNWAVYPMPSLPADQHYCRVTGGLVDDNGKKLETPPSGPTYTIAWDDEALTIDELVTDVLHLDRPVINKTGIAGLFTLHLVHRFDRTDPDDGSPVSNAHVAAIDLKAQLGLELRASTGPRTFLVIDHVEHPTPDDLLPAPQPKASAPAMQIKFDVVSIKPCETSGETAGRGGGAGGSRASVTPGYAHFECHTLSQIIDMAYGGGAFPSNSLLNTLRLPPGMRPDLPERVRGGPSWVNNDRFTFEIRISGDTTDLTGPARHNLVLNSMGPALRALLEDRFQLKLRKQTEQVPMYALTVAKSGLKIPQTAKPDEKCWVPLPPAAGASRAAEPMAPPNSEGLPPCHFGYQRRTDHGNKIWQLSYIGLSDLAGLLSVTVDRYVLDQTAATGRFSFTLEYAPDDNTPGDTNDGFDRTRADRIATPPVKGDGASIFKALESLGLKLEPTKGPAEYLLIESVQRPRPDAPSEVVSPPARTSGAGGAR